MGIDVEQLISSQTSKEVTVNDATGRLEGALANLVSIATADADVDLSASAASKLIAFSNFYFRLTGAMTAARGLTLPDGTDNGKTYFVENATTGGFAITVQRASGATVSVPAGESRLVYNDGTDILDLINASLSIAASIVTYDPGSPAKFGGADDVQEVLDLLGAERLAFDASSNVVTDSSGGLATLGGTREVLTANRTYYIRTDGDDANDGLTNSSGGAFETIQRFIDVVAGLDLSTYAVTGQLGVAGTYAGADVTAAWVGGPGSSVTLVGSAGSPTSYPISSEIFVSNFAVLHVSGISLETGARGLVASALGTIVTDGAVNFASGSIHARMELGGRILFGANYTISGGASYHWKFDQGSFLSVAGLTITLSGTPAFTAFLQAASGGDGQLNCTFAGTGATGARYDLSGGASLFTNGATDASFFPGDSPGSNGTSPNDGHHDMV